MNATIVDLRYKTKKILKALECREPVTIYYHGKVKGTIVPAKAESPMKAKEHPLCGYLADDKRPMKDVMKELRGGRYRDL